MKLATLVEREFGLRPAILQLAGHAAALIILPPEEYQPAACCDGRMVAMVINREGTTRCVLCDAKEMERRACEAKKPVELERVTPPGHCRMCHCEHDELGCQP